jgi:hypothetical protein
VWKEFIIGSTSVAVFTNRAREMHTAKGTGGRSVLATGVDPLPSLVTPDAGIPLEHAVESSEEHDVFSLGVRAHEKKSVAITHPFDNLISLAGFRVGTGYDPDSRIGNRNFILMNGSIYGGSLYVPVRQREYTTFKHQH